MLLANNPGFYANNNLSLYHCLKNDLQPILLTKFTEMMTDAQTQMTENQTRNKIEKL